MRKHISANGKKACCKSDLPLSYVHEHRDLPCIGLERLSDGSHRILEDAEPVVILGFTPINKPPIDIGRQRCTASSATDIGIESLSPESPVSKRRAKAFQDVGGGVQFLTENGSPAGGTSRKPLHATILQKGNVRKQLPTPPSTKRKVTMRENKPRKPKGRDSSQQRNTPAFVPSDREEHFRGAREIPEATGDFQMSEVTMNKLAAFRYQAKSSEPCRMESSYIADDESGCVKIAAGEDKSRNNPTDEVHDDYLDQATIEDTSSYLDDGDLSDFHRSFSNAKDISRDHRAEAASLSDYGIDESEDEFPMDLDDVIDILELSTSQGKFESSFSLQPHFDRTFRLDNAINVSVNTTATVGALNSDPEGSELPLHLNSVSARHVPTIDSLGTAFSNADEEEGFHLDEEEEIELVDLTSAISHDYEDISRSTGTTSSASPNTRLTHTQATNPTSPILSTIDPDRALTPLVRSPFPKPLRDRSPILGLSSTGVLRTCFRIGEALNAASLAHRTGKDVIIELYARVTSSSRQQEGYKQYFQFADLFHSERPPFLDGTYELWKNVHVWEVDLSLIHI